MDNFIAIADLHLRDDVPRCRGESPDEWFNHQKERLEQIVNYANKQRLEILIAGDIFHKPRPSHKLIGMFIGVMNKCWQAPYIMAGNHDLSYANADDTNTAYDIISKIFPPIDTQQHSRLVPYGKEAVELTDPRPYKPYVICLHTLLFEKEKDVPFGVQHFETAKSLATKYPYPCLVVGDMHRPFTSKQGDTFVVNCGSMTVQSINEAEYAHGFWEVSGCDSVAQFNEYTNDMIIVEDNYVETAKERDNRITAFVEKLKGQESITLDFKENLLQVLTDNAISSNVKSTVIGWIN